MCMLKNILYKFSIIYIFFDQDVQTKISSLFSEEKDKELSLPFQNKFALQLLWSFLNNFFSKQMRYSEEEYEIAFLMF